MLPKMMTFIRTERFGPPEVLLPAEMEVPAPGKGEVLIKVAAAGVNRPDVIQRTGHYPPPPGASDVLGLEVGGVVVGTGEGVAEPAVGARVCALVASGGYAEYCVAPAALCLSVPAPLSLIEAAGLPETTFTVWTNVFERGRLQAAESFLVHGGTSGIGTTAIPLAKAFGARVFATAGSAEKCQVCRDLGAEIAIDHRTEDFVAVVKEATGRRGVDVILDMVGGDYLQRNISALAPDGRLVQIAFLKGSKAELDLMPVMLKRLTVTGSTLRARPVADKAAIASTLKAKVWPLLDAGRLRPVIHTTLPLAEAAQAHRLMESNRHIGKIILTI
jgi:NADPH2:quinone reductase